MDYFYKIPFDLINPVEVDYKELLIRVCLDRYMSREGHTFTSISLICEQCGYSSDRHNNSFSGYARQVLIKLINNKEISQVYGKSVEKVSNTGLIGFYLEDKFFDIHTKMFAKLSFTVFDTLVGIDYPLAKSTLLKVYTYIRGRIIENPQQAYGFYGSIERAVKELDLSRKTVDTCLDMLVENNLFKRYITGSCYVNGTPRNVPNIYVLPDDNADNNIKVLLEDLKQKYKVDEFAPVLAPSSQEK